MRLRAAWGTLLLMVLFVTALPAQVTKGSISGTVVDPSGAVVSGAAVKAHDTQSGTELTTTTDKSGNFRFNLIPPGHYSVEISHSGFSKLAMKADVTVGQDTAVGQIHMSLGSVENTVEVSAATPLVETTEAQITTSYEQTQIVNFASLGDNQGLDRLALFVPGVVSSRSNNFSNTNGASFSVNGLRGRNNDQQIDGQNNNDNSVGGPALFLSNPEFVSEYNIVTSNFGPEYGRNAGSVVNLVTKSGTNAVHGSMYGSENNSILNSLTNIDKRFSGLTKLPRTNDEFAGFTIGGPIKKDKLFIFTGFDEEMFSGKSVFTSGTFTPTNAGQATLAGCYGNTPSLQALAKYGPFGVSAGNPTIKASKTINAAFFNADTATTTYCPGVQVATVSRTLPIPSHIFDWLQRVDYQGAKDNISARYLLQRNNSFNASGTGSTGYIVNVPDLNQQTRLGWTRTLSSKMTNDMALTFGRTNVQFGGNAMGTVPTTDGIATALSSIATGSGNLGFGPANNLPQGRIVNTWQFQDNWNYVMGKHSLKAGVNWTYQRSPNVFLPNLNGSYSITGSSILASGVNPAIPTASEAWGQYAANKFTSLSIALGQPVLDFREYDTFLYGGDDWKITQNLTINLGLTWSYYGQPANLFHTNDLKQQTGSNPFWNPALDQSITVSPNIPAPKNSFGPNIGFAYTPKFGGWLTGEGKTVIRGGYRLSYDPPFYNIYLNMASSAPQVLSQTLTCTPKAGSTCSGTGVNTPTSKYVPGLAANPTGPNTRAGLAAYLVTGVSDPRTFAQTKITNDFGPDHVQSWSFGVQRELVKKMVVEARYVGNKGTNLFQSINGNPFIANLAANYPGLVPAGMTPCTTPGSVGLGRVDCTQSVVRVRTNTGYSDYNGLQTEVRANNLFDQLTLRSAYTWSKTTDNVSEIFGTGSAGNTTAFAQNPVDYTKGEHGISGLDVPNKWAMSFYEQIPIFKQQKGLLGHILGGWNISGDYLLASGQPYSPIQSSVPGGSLNYSDTTFNNSFSVATAGTRPFLGNQNAPITSVGYYSNATTFLNLGTGVATTPDQVHFIVNNQYSQAIFKTPFGNAPRNGLRDFWQNIGDAKIIKSTKFNERWSADFHATMTNVFNHRNFSSADPFIDDAGLVGNSTGFADPTVWLGGSRHITFGATIRF
jgi:hypothetical protein